MPDKFICFNMFYFYFAEANIIFSINKKLSIWYSSKSENPITKSPLLELTTL
jgi:hypothetical protein